MPVVRICDWLSSGGAVWYTGGGLNAGFVAAFMKTSWPFVSGSTMSHACSVA